MFSFSFSPFFSLVCVLSYLFGLVLVLLCIFFFSVLYIVLYLWLLPGPIHENDCKMLFLSALARQFDFLGVVLCIAFWYWCSISKGKFDIMNSIYSQTDVVVLTLFYDWLVWFWLRLKVPVCQLSTFYENNTSSNLVISIIL